MDNMEAPALHLPLFNWMYTQTCGLTLNNAFLYLEWHSSASPFCSLACNCSLKGQRIGQGPIGMYLRLFNNANEDFEQASAFFMYVNKQYIGYLILIFDSLSRCLCSKVWSLVWWKWSQTANLKGIYYSSPTFASLAVSQEKHVKKGSHERIACLGDQWEKRWANL